MNALTIEQVRRWKSEAEGAEWVSASRAMAAFDALEALLWEKELWEGERWALHREVTRLRLLLRQRGVT